MSKAEKLDELKNDMDLVNRAYVQAVKNGHSQHYIAWLKARLNELEARVEELECQCGCG